MLDDVRPGAVVGFYDRDGDPLSLRQWGLLFGDKAYQRVAEDYLDDGTIRVSTVWMGMPLGLTALSETPMIFETMVFVRSTEEQVAKRRDQWEGQGWSSDDFPWEDLQCWRYATEDDAREGHRSAVDSLRLKIEILEEHLVRETEETNRTKNDNQ